jgi:thiol-disulfide isomerase/thioredoxin
MKTNVLKRVIVVAAACVMALTFAADDGKPEDAADAAWQEVLKALRPPPQPEAWRTKEPSKEEIEKWERNNGVLAGNAAEKARDFYTKYPSHAKADDARRREIELLSVAVQLGDTNRQARFDELQEKRLSDPTVSAEEKFDLRAKRILRLLDEEDAAKTGTARDKAEKATRDLLSDFPKRNEGYDLLFMIAQNHLESDSLAKARTLTEEVVKKAAEDSKEQAEVQLRKLNLVGKPFELKFTDLNGKDVNIKDYAGKVVLVDFWATWCPPCREALPEMKEIYAKYRGQGFEILGISFDNEKQTLTDFIAEEKISWPQRFDGLGWESQMATNYPLHRLPTMWLVDRKGVLRDLNGGRTLSAKLEKLLAEK